MIYKGYNEARKTTNKKRADFKKISSKMLEREKNNAQAQGL